MGGILAMMMVVNVIWGCMRRCSQVAKPNLRFTFESELGNLASNDGGCKCDLRWLDMFILSQRITSDFYTLTRIMNEHNGRQPKFTFSHFTRDPNLHNPHLHKPHIYTNPNLHGTQIYKNPNLHNLKYT